MLTLVTELCSDVYNILMPATLYFYILYFMIVLPTFSIVWTIIPNIVREISQCNNNNLYYQYYLLCKYYIIFM